MRPSMRPLLLKLIFLCIMIYTLIIRKSDRWLRREFVRRPINQLRSVLGFFNTQWQEMKEDPYVFHRYTAMNLETFQELLSLVSVHLQKNHDAALCPEERLIIALRYLVSGDQLFTIALWHRVGESTVAAIIKEVCEVLVEVLRPIYLRQPNEEEWKHIASTFLEKCNLPNCVGSIDGKHIQIRAPPHSGTLYYNHKGTFSTVLLGVCDANFIFTLVHVGEMGSNSDAGIFGSCPLGQNIQDDKIGLPRGVAELPGSNFATPCFFVGDDAFPLSKRLMKPYSGTFLEEEYRIFNYRICRARRTIENTFGILVNRFRVFESKINLHPESVDILLMAAVCLHNFLRIKEIMNNPSERFYDVPTFQPERYVAENNFPRNEDEMREGLKNYFLTPAGEVSWQNDVVNYTPNEWEEFDLSN